MLLQNGILKIDKDDEIEHCADPDVVSVVVYDTYDPGDQHSVCIDFGDQAAALRFADRIRELCGTDEAARERR